MYRITILACIVFFIFPATANAQVFLNELFPNPSGDSSEGSEFIEIYNNSDKEVDITNYIIEETKTYTIKDKKIPAYGFVCFLRSETGLALNNNGDKVTLKDSGANIVDSFEFKETLEDKSWARYPDGTGTFSNDVTPTRCERNTPGPSATLVPTSALSPTDSLKITETEEIVPTSGVLVEDDMPDYSNDIAINQNVIDKSSNVTRASTDQSEPGKSDYRYIITISFGLVLIVFSGYLLYKKST
ncbi:lamin tail domain-containing protein [Candidatus Woesebacteria bacterium]|nr:MAG: lamin tail domain-containing protein [Candidatus Woesebacteria bacterium]